MLLEFDGKVEYAEGDKRALVEEKRREDALAARWLDRRPTGVE